MSISLTLVVGRVVVPSGVVARNGRVKFALNGWEDESGTIIPRGPVEFALDAAGYLEASLWPTLIGARDLFYTVSVSYWNEALGRIEVEMLPSIRVPAAAAPVLLSELFDTVYPPAPIWTGGQNMPSRTVFVLGNGITPGLGMDAGQVVYAGGLAYVRVPGSTRIHDLFGWEPAGWWDGGHFGVPYGCVKIGGRWVGTDATAALQVAMDAASAARERLLIRGRILIAHKPGKSVWAIVPPSYVWLHGNGMICQDYDPAEVISGNGDKGFAIFQSSDWGTVTDSTLIERELFRMEGLSVRGLWDDHPRARKQVGLRLAGYRRVEAIGLDVRNFSGQWAPVEYCQMFVCRGGEYDSIASGNICGARYTGDILVDGVKIRKTGDDAIEFHATDGTPNNPEKPIRATATITNTHISNGRGIVALAGVDVILTSVHFNRTYGAISFIGNDAEGQGASRNLIMSGCTFTDVIRRPAMDPAADDNNPIVPTAFDVSNKLSVIALGNVSPAGDGTTVAPRQWDATSAKWVPPYFNYPGLDAGALNSRDTRGAKPGAPATSMSINNCQWTRTLPDKAGASSWSLGPLFTHYGFYNPPVTRDSFADYGISLFGPMTNVIISNPIVSGGLRYAWLNIDPQFAANRAIEQAVVQGGIVEDVPRCITRARANEDDPDDGVLVADTWGLTIRDIILRPDPWWQLSNRNGTTGAWTAVSNIFGDAINLGEISGVTLERVTFMDCARMVRNSDAALATWTMRDNIGRGGVQQIAFSTSNLGIGQGIDAPQDAVTYQDTETDKTNLKYGTVKAVPLQESAASPGVGCFYRRGHFVPNKTPSISSGKVLTGHMRLTSGRAAVAGTDWTPVYQTVT